jgi:dTDP-4-amino-4,6-dideoxygalactose transaminase
VLSWNGRISEIVAAVALEQLRAYHKDLETLRELAALFIKQLPKFEGIELACREDGKAKPVYTQVVVKLDPKLGLKKAEIMAQLKAAGIGVWHANFELINSLSFFKDGGWKDWIVKGDLRRIQNNYANTFANSQQVYSSLGLGFARSNFVSKASVQTLVKRLEEIFRTTGARKASA